MNLPIFIQAEESLIKPKIILIILSQLFYIADKITDIEFTKNLLRHKKEKRILKAGIFGVTADL